MIHVKCWVSQVGYNNQVEYKHDPFFWPEMFHPSSCVNSYAGLIVITRSDDLYHDVCVCVCVCVQNYKYVHLEHLKWCISAHLKAFGHRNLGGGGERVRCMPWQLLRCMCTCMCSHRCVHCGSAISLVSVVSHYQTNTDNMNLRWMSNCSKFNYH